MTKKRVETWLALIVLAVGGVVAAILRPLMRPIDYSCYAGASAFLSTPSDLVRFGMAIDGGKLLP